MQLVRVARLVRPLLVFTAVWLCAQTVRSVELADGAKLAEEAKSARAKTFDSQIKPFLKTYCYSCHATKQPKGGLHLDVYDQHSKVAADEAVWQKVHEYLTGRLMPPEKAQLRPSEEQYRAVTEWIEAELSQSVCSGPSNPGRVTMRRLNRVEYNNTVRDLVGVDFHPADDFPADDLGYGFDNNGDVLSVPPLLLEKYLTAADRVATEAIKPPEALKKPKETFAGRRLQGGQRGEGGRVLTSDGEIGFDFEPPRPLEYAIRVRAFGDQAGSEPVKMGLRIDGKQVHEFQVKAKHGKSEDYEHKMHLPAGKHHIAVAFLNDFYDPKQPNPEERDRNLHVERIELEAPLDAEARASQIPSLQGKIIFVSPPEKPAKEAARAVMQKFASRAFRRPVTNDELDRLVALVERVRGEGESFERGIQVAIQAVLCSPNFLYRVELDPAGSDAKRSDAKHSINDYELASRLSYFLWSSMPDDELLLHAWQGTLRKDGNLEKQVKRMLADPKSQALVDNFSGQWLMTRNLSSVQPDRKRFPSFNPKLRDAMAEETRRYFANVMHEDRSVLEFLDSDYTFLNERLAKHYGVPNVLGDEFRKVTLPSNQRGGVLTQASVLTVTSNPTRTSPVKRGKWVLEQLLGTPPPPPPPNVPQLVEAKEVELKGSLRQRMEQHRADPMCASCHARMDPIGFSLENFDAIGAWRDRDGAFAIDASGTLPDGKSFNGPAELRKILLARKDGFCHCLSEKLLTYALGRGMESFDRCAVDKMVVEVTQHDYRMSALILAVVQSEPFQMRGGKEAQP